MNKLEPLSWVKGANIFILLFLITYGCQRSTLKSQPGEPSSINHTGNIACWTPLIKAPFFNVTGFLTTPARPNSSIFLFVAPDTSFETSLYVVANCSFTMQRPIIRQTYFTFLSIPPGDYVAMLPRDSFPENIQGFPMIGKYNLSHYSIKVNFHGGNWKYSMLSFSIRPLQAEPEPKNSYS